MFPMQLLGWDVDVVNTVNFSNHSGASRVVSQGPVKMGPKGVCRDARVVRRAPNLGNAPSFFFM